MGSSDGGGVRGEGDIPKGHPPPPPPSEHYAGTTLMTDRLNPPHSRGLLAAAGGGGQVPLSWKYCLTVLDWAFKWDELKRCTKVKFLISKLLCISTLAISFFFFFSTFWLLLLDVVVWCFLIEYTALGLLRVGVMECYNYSAAVPHLPRGLDIFFHFWTYRFHFTGEYHRWFWITSSL